MKKTLLFILLVALAYGAGVSAEPWQGILGAERAIDWSKAGAQGGIPNRTSTCATLNPGATALQINAAIAGCPAGKVVKLNAGTYNLSSGITFDGKSNVTLRGAGPDATFLNFSGSVGCVLAGADICVYNNETNPENPQHSANWLVSYTRGAATITLSSVDGLAVGSLLNLDQLNDGNADNGNIWMCANGPYDSIPGSPMCCIEGDSGIDRPNRAQGQQVVVTSISGSGPYLVGITPGLYMPNWRSAQSPGAWWTDTTVGGVGIEDLSINNAASDAFFNIQLGGVRDSWVKNIRSTDSDRAHILGYSTARVTVRDSYFYGTKHAQSQSYGIEQDMTSDWLVENNIFQHVAVGMPLGQQDAGNVFGYNFSIDDYYGLSPAWMQASSYHHAAGLNYTLFEGNSGVGFTADAIHGTSHFMTAFRNYWTGWESGKSMQTNAINVYAFNRYFNFIGNILGRAGFHSNYEGYPASAQAPGPSTGASNSIYMLGWSWNEEKDPNVLNDPRVRATMMRWGNYDTVGAATRWQASEVPSGISAYANPVPGSQVLPSSFYLSAKPVWFGNVPWPPIGPNVSGGNVSGMGGHVNKIPAQVCFENVMAGTASSGVLSFNANRCYSESSISKPATPKNLRYD